jgi:AcrR family transcriptional regulator
MNHNDEKPDRRKRRTRALLRKALMELIVENGFDAISVQDIAERADVSRATFYLHYHTKEELLTQSMCEVYDELVEKAEHNINDEMFFRALSEGDHSGFYDATDFQHVAEHEDFYRVLLSENGVASFTVMVRDYLAKLVQEQVCLPVSAGGASARLPPEMIAHAVAGAEIGVISWWLKQGRSHSPEEMAKLFYQFTAFGFWWAMGLDVPTPTYTPHHPPGS